MEIGAKSTVKKSVRIIYTKHTYSRLFKVHQTR